MAADGESVQERFAAYYLQRVTAELAEDLDKVRSADDFRNDAVAVLVQALRQGTAMFSAADQERVVTATARGTAADVDMGEADDERATTAALEGDARGEEQPVAKKEKKKSKSKDKSKKSTSTS